MERVLALLVRHAQEDMLKYHFLTGFIGDNCIVS